jgi:hypothetical protein
MAEKDVEALALLIKSLRIRGGSPCLARGRYPLLANGERGTGKFSGRWIHDGPDT